MLGERRVLSIIPSRGGSKRLPHKNVLPLNGKPLIGWTIEAALQSQYIDEVVVSSDDNEIIATAQRFGASVPFKRPAELSGDQATTSAVVEHCLDYYADIGDPFQLIMILQPTSPLRTAEQIDEACCQLLAADAQGLISVCECEHSPLWSNTLPENLSMGNFISTDVLGQRSQDLETYYRLNGAIYLFDIEQFRRSNGIFYAPDVIAYLMDQHSSVDIDTLLDFKFAELLMNERQTK